MTATLPESATTETPWTRARYELWRLTEPTPIYHEVAAELGYPGVTE